MGWKLNGDGLMVWTGFELIEGVALACDGELFFAHALLDDGLFHARVSACQAFGVVCRSNVRVVLSIAGVVTRSDFALERTDHGGEAKTMCFFGWDAGGVEQDQVACARLPR